MQKPYRIVHYAPASLWACVQNYIKEHQLTKIISKERTQLLQGVDQRHHPAQETAPSQPWKIPVYLLCYLQFMSLNYGVFVKSFGMLGSKTVEKLTQWLLMTSFSRGSGSKGRTVTRQRGDTASLRCDTGVAELPSGPVPQFPHTQTTIYNHSLYEVFVKLLDQRSAPQRST